MDCDLYESAIANHFFTHPPYLKTYFDQSIPKGKKIGSGTYGNVYKLEDGKRVIKVLDDMGDAVIEILHLRRISPPFSTTPYFVLPEEVYWREKQCGIVLPKGDMDMEKYIENVEMSEDSKYRIMFHLAKAIEEMHYLNVVHLDLKPANIIMFGDEPRISDFGLSVGKVCHKKITGEKVSLGYRAPELYDANSFFSGKKADIWSLGMIFLDITLDLGIMSLLYYYHYTLSVEGKKYPNTKKLYFKLIKDVLSPESKKDCNIFEILRNKKVDHTLIDLLEDMLKINPKERLTAEQVVNSKFFNNIRQVSKLPKVPNKNCLYELKHLGYYPKIIKNSERKKAIEYFLKEYLQSESQYPEVFQRQCFIYDYYMSQKGKKLNNKDLVNISKISKVYETDKYQSLNIEAVKILEKIDYRISASLLYNFRDAQLKSLSQKKTYNLISTKCYINGNIINKYPVDILSTAIAWLAPSFDKKKISKKYCQTIKPEVIECIKDIGEIEPKTRKIKLLI